MKIEFEHKYGIGDTVWIMRYNMPQKTEVDRLLFQKGANTYSVRYNLLCGENDVDVTRLFPTKEELLKSL